MQTRTRNRYEQKTITVNPEAQEFIRANSKTMSILEVARNLGCNAQTVKINATLMGVQFNAPRRGYHAQINHPQPSKGNGKLKKESKYFNVNQLTNWLIGNASY